MNSILHKMIVRCMLELGYEYDHKDSNDCCLSFKGKDCSIVLRVVDELSGKAELLSAIIASAMDLSKGKVAYIAIPRVLISNTDCTVLNSYGIGLLVYDKHGIEEVIPASRRKLSDSDSHSRQDIDTHMYDSGLINEILERLERLERQIVKIFMVDELLKRLELLESRFESISKVSGIMLQERTQSIPVMAQPKDVHNFYGDENLPSFLKDNPWISILSGKTS